MSKVLTCEKLTKVYGKEKTALDGIDLELDFGRIVVHSAPAVFFLISV